MMHGGARWPERARNWGGIVIDHRKPWGEGPEPLLSPNKKVGEWEDTAAALLLQYLAMHGDWQEKTSHRTAYGGQANSIQTWDFIVCQCPVCQQAVTLVGHPSTPNG